MYVQGKLEPFDDLCCVYKRPLLALLTCSNLNNGYVDQHFLGWLGTKMISKQFRYSEAEMMVVI